MVKFIVRAEVKSFRYWPDREIKYAEKTEDSENIGERNTYPPFIKFAWSSPNIPVFNWH